jgi:hypothetical protein
MTLTTDQTNAANAALTGLQAALSAYAALGNPGAKDLYQGSAIFPLIAPSLSLCFTIGNAMADEQQAEAYAAITPYQADPNLTQIVGDLSAVRGIGNRLRQLNNLAGSPATALQSAELMVWIFQTVLAYVAAEATAQAAIVTAATAAATAAIGASSAQPVIVGAAVQAALESSGMGSTEAAAVGAAVQAALA